jgi:hypothetical protein
MRAPRQTPEQIKQIKEAFEQGLKIVPPRKNDNAISEAPLFGQVNAKQMTIGGTEGLI